MIEWIAAALLVGGALLALLATVGLQRFNDVFGRMHSATKPATLGLMMILAGSALVLPVPGAVAKLGLVILFQFVTAPIAAHLVGRAAFRAGNELDPDTMVTEDAESILGGDPN
jgi:multicomponent Na+:H+ antiporter subunit G